MKWKSNYTFVSLNKNLSKKEIENGRMLSDAFFGFYTYSISKVFCILEAKSHDVYTFPQLEEVTEATISLKTKEKE